MKKPNRRSVLRFLTSLSTTSAVQPLLSAAAAAPAEAASLRISRYEVIPVRVPWAARVRDSLILNWRRAGREEPHLAQTMVRLYTDAGLVGVGDSSSEAAARRTVGRSPWEFVLDDTLGGVLVAIYDLLGQATGVPMCRLFGGSPQPRIQPAFWSHCYPPDLMAAEAKLGASLGFRIHKVKARPWEDAVEQGSAISGAVPRDYRVWADANGFWGSVGRTLQIALGLGEIPNYFAIESPLRHTEGYRQLKGKLPLRLAEHYGVLDPMTAIREGLVDSYVVAGRLGRTMVRLNAMAEFHRMPLWTESNCWTGIGQVFQAQQAAALPGIEYTINCAHIAEDDLMREPFTVRDGFYEVPRTPGLGATLDDNALDKYRAGKGARS